MAKSCPLFRVGQRVQFTEAAYEAGLVRRGTTRPPAGVVVAYPASQLPLSVKVRRDGQKTVGAYHVVFWEPARRRSVARDRGKEKR